VARFAANQQAPSLSNGAGMLMAAKSGDPAAVSCVTFPPFAGECQSQPAAGMTLAAELGAEEEPKLESKPTSTST